MFVRITAFLALMLVFAATGPKIYNNYTAASRLYSTPVSDKILIPPTKGLKSNPQTIKIKPAEKTLQLEKSNTVVLKGPVTAQSVATVQNEIQHKAFKLSKTKPIYLVLDTPGGSVFAGLQLIDFIRSLDHKVHTVTLFAASMGFQIAQNLDTRYIGTSATLMSHRAKLGGFGGQLDGEFESRYLMIKRQVDYLDTIAANRMKLSLPQYKQLILNEYWVHGYDSIAQNAADEQVNLTCGQSMAGTKQSKVNTIFGQFEVKFSECPLIKAPLAVEYKGKHVKKLTKIYNDMYNNNKYLKEYILTNKHYSIFKN